MPRERDVTIRKDNRYYIIIGLAFSRALRHVESQAAQGHAAEPERGTESSDKPTNKSTVLTSLVGVRMLVHVGAFCPGFQKRHKASRLTNKRDVQS